MVRSKWKRTLAATLAWAGLACGQQPLAVWAQAPAPAPLDRTERIITVQETGKPAQKCKLLKTWRTPEGAQAYQVQALMTGELMTIVESGPTATVPSATPGTRLQARATRIFHWGESTTPPVGVPLPPTTTVVQNMPTPALPDSKPGSAPASPRLTATPAPMTTASKTVATPGATGMPSTGARPSTPLANSMAPTPLLLPPPTTTGSRTSTPVVSTMNPPAQTTTPARMPPAGDSRAPATTMTTPNTKTLSSTPSMPPQGNKPAPTSVATTTSPTSPSLVPGVEKRTVSTAQPNPVATTTLAPSTNATVPPKSDQASSSPAATGLPRSFASSWAATQMRTAQATPNGASALSTSSASSGSNSAPSSSGLDQQMPKAQPLVRTPKPTPVPEETRTVQTPTKVPLAAPQTSTTSLSLPTVKPTSSYTETRGSIGTSTVTTGTQPAAKTTSPYTETRGPTGTPMVAMVTQPVATPTSPYAEIRGSTGTSTTVIAAQPPVQSTSPYAAFPQASGASTVTQATDKTVSSSSSSLLGDWRRSWGKANEHKPLPPPPPVSHVDAQRPDPLKDPERYTRRSVEDKPAPAAKPVVKEPAVQVAKPAVKEPAAQDQVASRIPEKSQIMPMPGTPLMTGAKGQTPLGMQSVLAAGPPAGVQYMPVPVVTIPDVRHVPMPPPGPQGAAVNTANGEYANAFFPAQPGRAGGQWGGEVAMVNAFTPAPARDSAFPAVMPPPNAMAGMYPPNMGGMYPPNVIMGMQQAGYPAPGGMGVGVTQVVANRPVDRRSPSVAYAPVQEMGAPNIPEMLGLLRDSLYPSQREWAVENLAPLDWRMHPDVVQALVTAAREDPAATVRASSVRALARMNANSITVVSAVQALQADSDPRVRHEVERALTILTAGVPTPLGQTIRPVSHGGSERMN